MRYFFLILIFFLSFNTVIASSLLDSDKDGILDRDELDIYKTDINNHDTDNDGYSDWLELNNGFFFFIDEEMFNKVCNIFKIKRAKKKKIKEK